MVYSDLSYAYKRLKDTLGEERVSTEEAELFVYGHDFSLLPKHAAAQFQLKPDIVVLPKSTQEVVRVLQLGRELDIPVVPRGGGTSLHGGSIPNVGGILLSTALMNRIDDVDVGRQSITVQAGVVWKDVVDAAALAGMHLPVAPIFHRSSTVGGFLSNGGAGIGAYKYGPPTQWVRSLEVVLPDGEIVNTAEAGFDLGPLNHNMTGLFMGAEGTLGVITKATLRILPKPQKIEASAYSFRDTGEMVDALQRLSRSAVVPYHIGFYDDAHLVLQRAILKQLPEAGGAVVLAFDGAAEDVQAQAAAAGEVLTDARKEGDETASTFWKARHQPYDARRISGGLVAAEGIVPLHRLDEAIELTRATARKIKAEPAFHGFLLDRGSAYLAPYILVNERNLRGQFAIAFVERYHRVLQELDGHAMGLGLLTTYNLEAMFGHVSTYMRQIKQALDPKAIVNRGKLLGTMGKKPPLAPPELPAGLMRRGLRALGALRKLMPSDRYISKLRGGR